MTRPAGLILDYGNVLSRAQDQAWMDGAARRLGADATVFRAAYWQHRHACDADLPAAGYWRRVVAAARPPARPERSGVADRLRRLAKPDPRIFRLCLERLGLSAGAALFVDDRADNVETAAGVGLQTLRFEGPDALERLQALVR